MSLFNNALFIYYCFITQILSDKYFCVLLSCLITSSLRLSLICSDVSLSSAI